METKKKRPTIDEIIKGLDNLSYYHDEKGVHEFLRGAIGLIQDLQSEKDHLNGLNTELLQENNKQKAEIERLTKIAEDKALQAIIAQNCVLNEQNSELQKQVDELKAKHVIECHGMLKGCDMVNQAVKDTAKKYHDAVKELFSKWDCCGCVEDRSAEEWYEDNDKIAREQFGVEVE